MKLKLDGFDELRKKLGDFKALDVLTPPMQDAMIRLEGRMKQYPPQRPTKYIRTGVLGKRWVTKVERQGGRLVGSVGNNTTYAPFVQSAMFQAKIHQGRWQTDQIVMDEEQAAIIRDFERAIAEAL